MTRRGLVLGLLLTVSIGLGVASLMSTSRSWSRMANQSRKTLGESRLWFQDIQAIRNRPRTAALEVETPEGIAIRVAEEMVKAELVPMQLVSLDPQPIDRQERTDFATRATLLNVRNASLAKLSRFVVGLQDRESGLLVTHIALTRSEVVDVDELWNARLTLTQKLFSPISDR
jgi:hypothetical protein